MADYLPHHVVMFDILTRIPVKALLRMRCVCKSWNSLISSPSFITAHINQTLLADKKKNNQNNELLVLRHFVRDDKEYYSIRCNNNTFNECTTFDCPVENWAGFYLRIVGSSNGLLCLSDDIFGPAWNITLWNPAIKRSLNLPMPRVTYESHRTLYMFVLGFGFDPRTNDYKVVRIAYFKEGSCYRVPPEVDVYTLSTGSWRTVSSVAPPYNLIERNWSHASVNGACHWVGFEAGKEVKRYLILSFDMGTEVFHEMMLPDSVANVFLLFASVAVYGESICIFHYDQDFCHSSKNCDVWVMKEYGVVDSWTKLFRLDLGGISNAVGFRKNGEILVADSKGELVTYDHKNGQMVYLGIHGMRRSFHLDTYMESLALLEKGNEVLAEKANSGNALLDKGKGKTGE